MLRHLLKFNVNFSNSFNLSNIKKSSVKSYQKIKNMFAARKIFNFQLKNIKNYSNRNAVGGQSLVDKITLTKNGKCFVAWHPEPKIDYEFTRPIPKIADQESSSLLKDTAMKSAMTAFKTKHPEVARQELMKITHTTKHRWFPRSRDKKAKKTPMDREFL